MEVAGRRERRFMDAVKEDVQLAGVRGEEDAGVDEGS